MGSLAVLREQALSRASTAGIKGYVLNINRKGEEPERVLLTKGVDVGSCTFEPAYPFGVKLINHGDVYGAKAYGAYTLGMTLRPGTTATLRDGTTVTVKSKT